MTPRQQSLPHRSPAKQPRKQPSSPAKSDQSDLLQRAINDPSSLTPETVQMLQASHGNQYVADLVQGRSDSGDTVQRESAPVAEVTQQQPESEALQRLSMSEKPIDTDDLASIKNITGAGTTGVAALIENEKGEQIVAKSVAKRLKPEEAVMASKIMKQSGVWTPDIRVASTDDREALFWGLQNLGDEKEEYQPLSERFLDVMISTGLEILIMEFVPGKTLGHLEAADDKRPLADVFNDPTFQRELGMILATDSFYGEGDRIHLLTPRLGDDEWDIHYNAGNLMIIKGDDGYHAVPIDNDFTPSLAKTGKPFAKGTQDSSLTVASSVEDFEREAGAFYDAVIKLEAKPKGIKALFGPLQKWKKKKAAWESNRAAFVDTVVQSGRETLERLMQRGQGWKQQLGDADIDDKVIKNFRERKRFIRLLQAGVNNREAIAIARNQDRYRKWRLTAELKFPEDLADQVIEAGDGAYKRSVEESIKQGKPVFINAIDLRN